MGQNYATALGDYLSARLKADGVTIEEFSRASGLTTSTISRAIRAEVEIGLNKLVGIAEGLGMTPWELLREVEIYKFGASAGRRPASANPVIDKLDRVLHRTDKLGRETILNAITVAEGRITPR